MSSGGETQSQAVRAAETSAEQPLRVIAWPAFQNRAFNPYTALLCDALTGVGCVVEAFTPRKLLLERWDIWHVHWPDLAANDPKALVALKRGLGFLVLVLIAKAKGIRIVWTVHNLRDHDRRHPALQAAVMRCFLPAVDGYLSLSETARSEAVQVHPRLDKVPGYVTRHGHYRGAYPDAIDKDSARNALALSARDNVILFFGQLRPYKQVIELISTFSRIQDPAWRLLVVGHASDPRYGTMVESAAKRDIRVFTRLELIPDDEVQIFMRAADLVVLPYQEVLNSGAALLALSFAVPTLVPRVGSLGKLAKEFGPGWVNIYDGELTVQTLIDAMPSARHAQQSGRPHLESALGNYEWQRIAEATLQAYLAIRSRRLRRIPG
jgi:beta-1,4-mannosyltransferase